MPNRCKCSISVESCKIHDICKCGQTKKIVSEYCRNCFLLIESTKGKYNCEICGKRRKKTTVPRCRKCYDLTRTERIVNNTKLLGEVLYDCGIRNQYNYIRSQARQLISSLKMPKVCKCCAFSEGVQVCHIKPIASFSRDSLVSEINSIENIILLCPNCHWLFDHGYDSLEKLREYYNSR